MPPPVMMTIEDLVLIHGDMTLLRQFIGNILPEHVHPEQLEALTGVQTLIEEMIKVMKKNAIAHQFK